MRSLRAGAKLSAAVALTLILVLGLVRIAAAQNAGAANPPLNFDANYFVTGDYVVAGAQGLNASFGSDGFGTGTITFPDGNPGIRGRWRYDSLLLILSLGRSNSWVAR